MIDKLNTLFAATKSWEEMTKFVGMCGQLIGYFEQHKIREGEDARNAAIDTLIDLLNAEKNKH